MQLANLATRVQKQFLEEFSNCCLCWICNSASFLLIQWIKRVG